MISQLGYEAELQMAGKWNSGESTPEREKIVYEAQNQKLSGMFEDVKCRMARLGEENERWDRN